MSSLPLLAATLLLSACGAAATAAPATDATTSTSTTVAPLVATATMPAVRVTTTVPTVETAPVDLDAVADAAWAGYPCNQWAGEALAAGWPVEQMPKLLRTMFRESRCDMNARSTTSDSCGMQINDIVLRDWRFKRDWPGFDQATIFDPAVCLSVAYWLWKIDNWTPWRGGA